MSPPDRIKGGKVRTASYAYEDAEGAVGRIVSRYEGQGEKTFRQGHVVAGEYVHNGDDVPMVPYRLPRLLTAAALGELVYVAEGEKDVQAIEAAGRTATCNPGGAEKWDETFGPLFVGVPRVIVVADKDDAGYRHARQVVDSLLPYVPVVKVRTAREGKDAADHLAAGYALTDLERPPRISETSPVPKKPRARNSSQRSGALAAVLNLLNGVEQVGEAAWQARCPAHDDRNPSLSVSVGDQHPVVVYCHAGCSVEDVADALGLPLGKLCASAAPGAFGLSSVALADIEFTTVEPLWYPWIDFSMLTVIGGEPDQGKSLLTVELAARFSTGRPMPFSDLPPVRGTTLLCSAEDDPSNTLGPRLLAAGGDPAMVRVIQLEVDSDGFPSPLFLPSGIRELERVIVECGAKFVVIDPLTAFISPTINSHNDASIRTALTPLKVVAQRTGAAIVMVRHFNKTPGMNAMNKGGGSVAITGIARSDLMVSRIPGGVDDDVRVVAPIKNNNHKKGSGLSFRIIDRSGYPAIEWIGPVTHTADDLVASADGRLTATKRDAATEFLEVLLAGGPVPTDDVLAAGKEAGHKPSTLRSARKRMRGRSYVGSDPDTGQFTMWFWALPEDDVEGSDQ